MVAPITLGATPKDSPALEIGDSEKPTPENPFTSDAVVPCRDDEDRAEARKAVESLGAEIGSLDEASSPLALEKVRRRLTALLDTPCFELAKSDLREPLEFDSGLALKTWWWEGGGESALILRVSDNKDERYPAITIPAQPVPSLLLLGHETHPLAPLMCAATDYDCGRDTRGWARRTTTAFRADRRQMPDASECEKNLLNEEPENRWSALVNCEVDAAPVETTLPLGRFRAMNDGYFVITSPHSSCASVDVYDLASGAAIKSSSCGRSPVEIGRVPLASIREAAWMTALAAYAKDNVRQSTSFTIPERVAPGRTREDAEHARFHLSGHYGRGPQSSWTWYRRVNGKMVAQVTGTTYGPTSFTASRYAVELLRIAEESFAAGCAPAFSPASLASIPWREPGPMVHENVSLGFDFASPDLDAARRAIPNAKSPKKCVDLM